MKYLGYELLNRYGMIHKFKVSVKDLKKQNISISRRYSDKNSKKNAPVVWTYEKHEQK